CTDIWGLFAIPCRIANIYTCIKHPHPHPQTETRAHRLYRSTIYLTHTHTRRERKTHARTHRHMKANTHTQRHAHISTHTYTLTWTFMPYKSYRLCVDLGMQAEYLSMQKTASPRHLF